MLYTPLSSNFMSLFLKICFPPSLGSMIFKNAWMQNHAKNSFLGPPIARITPILELFMAPEICKIGGKMCISRLCAFFGSFVWPYVFYRMHFEWKFHIFAMISSWSCFKFDPEVASHKYVRLPLPATYVVYMSPWCRLAGVPDRRLWIACFHSQSCPSLPSINCRAAALPSPEGLQYGQPLAG